MYRLSFCSVRLWLYIVIGRLAPPREYVSQRTASDLLAESPSHQAHDADGTYISTDFRNTHCLQSLDISVLKLVISGLLVRRLQRPHLV